MPLTSLPDARRLGRRAWGRGRLERRTRTFLLSCLVIIDVSYSATAIDARAAAVAGLTVPQTGTTLSGYAGAASVVGLALAVAVIWRHRYPVPLAAAGVVGSVAFQLGPTAALIGFMSVVLWRPMQQWWMVGLPVAAVTLWRVWVDVTATPRTASFWRTLVEPASGSVPWYVAVILALALLAGFGGAGLWLRTRSELASANRVVAAERHQVSTLTDQVSRQAERERLAREIHDGLGHNLSILSVHAGALEAMAQRVAASPDGAADGTPRGADPVTGQLQESAKVVRETAARSVAELHSLLDLLRNPDDADLAAPTKTLRDVRSLIDESVTAGMPLIATVYVDDSLAVDAHIAQAAYRIVQELLTNARKHAATIPVRLTMSGSPAEGALVIATANHLPTQGSGRPAGPNLDGSHGGSGPAGAREGERDDARAGTGLSGIRERVERYGGDMAAGVDPYGVFRVSVRLPWAPPDPTRDAGGSR